jgi:hypothetical protein
VTTSPAVPFKQSCIPELRCVHVHLQDDVAGMLTSFDDIHRHGQLEKLKISGCVDVNNNGNLPRPADLRQWLTMSTSYKFTFEMDLILTGDDNEHLTTMLTEYQRVTSKARSEYSRRVNILYPTMSLVQPVEWDDDDSSADESMNEDVDDPIDTDISEVRRRISISCNTCRDVHSSTLPNPIARKTHVSRK